MSFRDLTPWRKHRDEQALTTPPPVSSFQEEMNRFFDHIAPGFLPSLQGNANGVNVASVDISESEKEITVIADMPGMEEEDIDITLNDGVLTLKGERETEHESKDKDFLRVERSYGTFMRRIQLPADIDDNAVKADFSKGVLKVVLPKTAEAAHKAKRIKVTSH